jgi:Do/DeqQ family serine protease
LLSVFAAAAAPAQLPFSLDDGEKPSLAPLLKEVTPAVVNISVLSRTRPTPNPLFEDPFFRRFFPELPESVPRQSAGSGVIIDAEQGHILTNHHVIANAEEIVVTLSDRRRLTAELIGSDEGTDVALLRIEAPNLTAVALGDSRTVEVGDFVIAIGNPFGLGQTVTSGIVSALGRSGLGIEGYEDFIQTDASINPGNSGGALIDLNGELVGINTAIVSPGGGNVGIGFAVPVDMVEGVMRQLIEYGEVQRGRLGIYIQDVTPDLAQALGLDVQQGAVVTQVEPGSAADQAGVTAGDVIVELNGEPVENATHLRNRVGLMRLGTRIDLTYVRDGRRREVAATISEGTGGLAAGTETIDRLQGAEFGAIPPGHPQYGNVQGIAVLSVMQGSAAARSGLAEGDIITAVNRRPVRSVQDLADAIGNAGGAVALNVIRGNARLFIVIQ